MADENKNENDATPETPAKAEGAAAPEKAASQDAKASKTEAPKEAAPAAGSAAPAEKAAAPAEKAQPEKRDGKGSRSGTAPAASPARPQQRGRPGPGNKPERGRGGGGRGGPRRGEDEQDNRFEERVIKINRCATVVKGGRRFSFSALVIIGDRGGQVGVGFGKANEVPPTVEKAVKDGKKNMFKVPVVNGTIPHEVIGEFRSSRVVMLPASQGTGVIAGSTVRAVVECAGIQNILTKSIGSNNPMNLAKAAAQGLRQLRTRETVFALRGVNE